MVYPVRVRRKSTVSGILRLAAKYVRGEEGREAGDGAFRQDNCAAEEAELWAKQRAL